jgi:hypothetical protein
MTDLERRVAGYRLPDDRAERALAAARRFEERVRLGSDERSRLLAQLTGVLGAEERENFDAALARRPVVQSSKILFSAHGTARVAVPAPVAGAQVRKALLVNDSPTVITR